MLSSPATQAYTVATKDGRLITGLVASETANSVTLRRQEGKEDVILRSDIEEMTASGQSFMAEGLEKELTQARHGRPDRLSVQTIDPPPKAFEGNHPRLVKPGPDGTIILSAAAMPRSTATA